jgi:ABC-type transport system involved in multi-copper enzyme maturation permease subunit
MIRQLAVKELRETAGLTALALLAFFVLVTHETGFSLFFDVTNPVNFGQGSATIPFVHNDFLIFFSLITGTFAILLGLRQSVWESLSGTYLFLLHRPLSRERIVAVRLTVGVALLLVCSGVPLFLYALWAALPGTHASPFEWSMTAPAWNSWLVMTIVYFGFFLSGMRPARWYASRLFPAATACLLVFLGVILFMEVPWWNGFVALATVLLVDAMLVAMILYVARTRDYA